MIWYCKNKECVKLRTIYLEKDASQLIKSTYKNYEAERFEIRPIRQADIASVLDDGNDLKPVNLSDLTSQTVCPGGRPPDSSNRFGAPVFPP